MPTIHATPFDYTFPLAHTALIAIDMQRDFMEPGGFGAALGNNVSLLRPIVPALANTFAACRAHGIPIIHTREGHKPDLSDCPPAKIHRGPTPPEKALKIGDPGPMGRILILGEPGNDIIPELAPLPGELIIDKPGKGAFYATSLHTHLQKHHITHLLFAGVTTEVCVQTTMREANDRGYTCLLLEDCTESYFPHFKKAAIEMITAQSAIVGWSAPSTTFINSLKK